jgi:hypothetical protein
MLQRFLNAYLLACLRNLKTDVFDRKRSKCLLLVVRCQMLRLSSVFFEQLPKEGERKTSWKTFFCSEKKLKI